MAYFFILGLESKSGNFAYVPTLQPGEQKTVAINIENGALSPADLSAKISHDVAAALVRTGLFQREADAMVNTWRDSWFAEDGVRVLYLVATNLDGTHVAADDG